eukprot:gene5624-6999_t
MSKKKSTTKTTTTTTTTNTNKVDQPIKSILQDDRSFYEILGVDKKASDSDIKKAYYKLAREVHPDKNKSPEAKEEFQKLGRIYSILSDSKKRKFYDEHGDTEGTEFADGLTGQDLYELWLKQYNIVRVSKEIVEEYFGRSEKEKKDYGLLVSTNEEKDLIQFYNDKKGDMKMIKEYVIGCETKKDVIRMCDHLNSLVKQKKLQNYPKFYQTATLSADNNQKSKNNKQQVVEEEEEEEEMGDDCEVEEEDELIDDINSDDFDEDEEEEQDEKPKKSNNNKNNNSKKVPKGNQSTFKSKLKNIKSINSIKTKVGMKRKNKKNPK